MEHVSNEQKAKEMFPFYEDMDDIEIVQTVFKISGATEMAEWKDEQLYNELFKLSLSSNLHDYLMWVCNKKKELEEKLKNKSNE